MPPSSVLLEGRTPGKVALRLRVVWVDGGPLTGVVSSFRYLAKVLQVLAGQGLLFGVVLFDGSRRGLHDYLCETRVVVDDGSPAPSEVRIG